MNLATSSPMMKPEAFQGSGAFGHAGARSNEMTVNGAITKTAILLAICVATAVGSWVLINANRHGLMLPLAFGGLIAGVIAFLIMIFKPESSPFVAPI